MLKRRITFKAFNEPKLNINAVPVCLKNYVDGEDVIVIVPLIDMSEQVAV